MSQLDSPALGSHLVRGLQRRRARSLGEKTGDIRPKLRSGSVPPVPLQAVWPTGRPLAIVSRAFRECGQERVVIKGPHRRRHVKRVCRPRLVNLLDERRVALHVPRRLHHGAGGSPRVQPLSIRIGQRGRSAEEDVGDDVREDVQLLRVDRDRQMRDVRVEGGSALRLAQERDVVPYACVGGGRHLVKKRAVADERNEDLEVFADGLRVLQHHVLPRDEPPAIPCVLSDVRVGRHAEEPDALDVELRLRLQEQIMLVGHASAAVVGLQLLIHGSESVSNERGGFRGHEEAALQELRGEEHLRSPQRHAEVLKLRRSVVLPLLRS
eukprot:scaffold1659_cov255-Pinguiococcus_pyrenoidosus.AAC.32